MDLEKWTQKVETLEQRLEETEPETEDWERIRDECDLLMQALEAAAPEDDESEEYYQWMLLLDRLEEVFEELEED